MLVNADCTLYRFENNGFVRYIINDIYWRENKAGNVLKSGLVNADRVTIFLYSDAAVPRTPTKDMLVKGICDFEFDNSTQKAVSESLKAFRENFDFVTVMSVDNMMFGGLPHIEISCQ